MTTRIRSTWAGRTAGNPPAVPGYNVEDKDHPAHQPEPEAHKYENGTTSDWNEDPRKPPYPQGNPPATPGYDIEDKDHPAHIDPPRWPEIKPQENGKQASEVQLRELLVSKAAKVMHVSRLMMASKKDATQLEIEANALDLMDLSDGQLASMAQRLGGGFLATDDKKDEVKPDEKKAGEMPPQFKENAEKKQEEAKDKPEEKKAGEMPPQFKENAEKKKEEAEGKDEKKASRKLARRLLAEAEEDDKDDAEKKADKKAQRKLAMKMLAESDEDEKDEKKAGQNAPGGNQNASGGERASSKTDEQARQPEVIPDNVKGHYASKEEEEAAKKKAGEMPDFIKEKIEDKKDEKKDDKKAAEDDKKDEKKAADDEGAKMEDDAESESKKAARALFATFGANTDGFVKKADWKGPAKMFAALDSDADGIVAEQEFLAAVGCGDAMMAPQTIADLVPDMGIDESNMFAGGSPDLMDDPQDDALLASIFGDKAAAETGAEDDKKDEKKAGEEELFEETEEEKKKKAAEAGKTAAVRTAGQKPQPRKPSTGVQKVGSQQAAPSRSDNDDLSALWDSAPDVSHVFGK